MTSEFKAIIVGALVMGVIVVIFFFTAQHAIDNSEQYECVTWKSEAKNFPNYYITKWQKEQCDHWNIAIPAPVQ